MKVLTPSMRTGLLATAAALAVALGVPAAVAAAPTPSEWVEAAVKAVGG